MFHPRFGEVGYFYQPVENRMEGTECLYHSDAVFNLRTEQGRYDWQVVTGFAAVPMHPYTLINI